MTVCNGKPRYAGTMECANAKRKLAFISSPHLILTCTSLSHFGLVLQHVVLDLIDTIKQYSATGYSTAQEVSSSSQPSKIKISARPYHQHCKLPIGLATRMRLFRKKILTCTWLGLCSLCVHAVHRIHLVGPRRSSTLCHAGVVPCPAREELP